MTGYLGRGWVKGSAEPSTDCPMVLPAWMGMATTLSHTEILQDVYLTPILPMAMARPLWGLEDMEHSSLSPPQPCNAVSDARGGQ